MRNEWENQLGTRAGLLGTGAGRVAAGAGLRCGGAGRVEAGGGARAPWGGADWGVTFSQVVCHVLQAVGVLLVVTSREDRGGT